MLVLSRKLQQQIVIPGLNIRVTVLSIGANRVQLGIEAPRGIQITRPELSSLTPAAPAESTLRDPADVPCNQFIPSSQICNLQS